MITYALERIEQAYDTYSHHWLEHYHHEVANLDYPVFGDRSVDIYRSIEEKNILRLMVARQDGTAIGYCTALVSPSWQSAAHIAQVDMLFVRPDKRKLFVGLLLLRHMIERLRDEGITQFRAMSSSRLDSGAVWRWLGFTMTGMIYERSYPARGH